MYLYHMRGMRMMHIDLVLRGEEIHQEMLHAHVLACMHTSLHTRTHVLESYELCFYCGLVSASVSSLGECHNRICLTCTKIRAPMMLPLSLQYAPVQLPSL